MLETHLPSITHSKIEFFIIAEPLPYVAGMYADFLECYGDVVVLIFSICFCSSKAMLFYSFKLRMIL